MLKDPAESIALLHRARSQGLTSSFTLMHDAVFDPLRKLGDFRRELDQAQVREQEARVAFDRAGGQAILGSG
jgi:hypothetical protein